MVTNRPKLGTTRDDAVATWSEMGRNLAAVEALVASLELDERGHALAELARTLAITLDNGAGLATAGISKELRSVLDALQPVETDSDDDFFDTLPSSVGNRKN